MGAWRSAAEWLGLADPEPEPAGQGRHLTAVRDNGGGAPVPPARPPASDMVTVDRALSLGPVYRAVSLLVTGVSQMRLHTLADGYEVASDQLVRSPSRNMSRSAFVEQTVFSLAAYGNAYWNIIRDNQNRVVALDVLDPDSVAAEQRLDRWGMPSGVTYTVGGREIPAGRLKHLRLLRRPGKAAGVGPIQAAPAEIAAGLRVRDFAAGWYTSGTPSGYLTTDQVLGPDESEAYAEAWRKFVRDHEGMGVLSSGLSYEHVQIDPEKAQLVDIQKQVVVNIARLFGIPAPLLLAEIEGSSMTYENMGAANLRFLQMSLVRYMNEVETAFSAMIPAGRSVRFVQSDLLRLDPQTQNSIDVAQIKAGLRSVAEIRHRDGLQTPPAEGELSPEGARNG